MIEVDIWADVRCPWCWVGLRRLRRIRAGLGEPVVVRWRSFLLEPDGPPGPSRATAEVATSEWGMTPAQWEAKSRHIRAEGRVEGVDIVVDGALIFDSNPVHRVLRLAAASGSVDLDNAWDSAFEAHFGRNENLGDPETLRQLAATWGLVPDDVDGALAGETFADEVARDVDDARRLMVTSVPTVVDVAGRRISGTAQAGDMAAFLAAAGAVR